MPGKQGDTVSYAGLIDGNIAESGLKVHPVEGESAAAAVCIPANMRDVKNQTAELSGVSFASLVKTSPVECLSGRDG